MTRRSLLMTLGVVLFLLGSGGAGIFLLIRHEPAAFRRAAVPPGPERTQHSKEFLIEFSELLNATSKGYERDWDVRMTEKQVNSYFAEDFLSSHLDEHLLPDGISEPRILFEPGKVRFAFRYGKGLLSSIISLDFNVWLTSETNTIAMQLTSLQAGSMPIGAQLFLDDLSVMLENNGIQVSWHRHEGHPVALLRFQADARETTVQLQHLQIDQGNIIIRGKAVEPGLQRTALVPQHSTKPVAPQ